MKVINTVSFVFLCIVCVSCSPSTKQIRRMQQLETGVVNPTTIDELESAIKTYQKRIEDVLNSDVRIGIWYKILGTRYMDNGMYGKALENFQTAIEYFPTNQNLYYFVGVCAGYMAKASLDFAASSSHIERDHYYNLSESAYKRALELEPRYERALYGLSVLYVFELDRAEEAIPYLERIMEIEKRNLDAMTVLARAYYVTGTPERAIQLYDRIISESKSEERKEEARKNKEFILGQTYEAN